VYKAFLQAYIQKGLHRQVNPYSHMEKSLFRLFLQASVKRSVSRHVCRPVQRSVCKRILTRVHREVCVCVCGVPVGL
jgi:hypothetical protein